MGLTTVGDLASLQKQFEAIREEIDKKFDKTILDLEETSWNIIRKKRDYLLWTTDWSMTPGCTVDQASWAAYRQALRDIPQTYKSSGFASVIWPKAPSTNGPNTKSEEE
tara:strand:+ start:141 stop:467 length:327 start_codon:yes stop_codon:yes gene_type:complete